MHLFTTITWFIILVLNLINMARGGQPQWVITILAIIGAMMGNFNAFIIEKYEDK